MISTNVNDIQNWLESIESISNVSIEDINGNKILISGIFNSEVESDEGGVVKYHLNRSGVNRTENIEIVEEKMIREILGKTGIGFEFKELNLNDLKRVQKERIIDMFLEEGYLKQGYGGIRGSGIVVYNSEEIILVSFNK